LDDAGSGHQPSQDCNFNQSDLEQDMYYKYLPRRNTSLGLQKSSFWVKLRPAPPGMPLLDIQPGMTFHDDGEEWVVTSARKPGMTPARKTMGLSPCWCSSATGEVAVFDTQRSGRLDPELTKEARKWKQ
jgi:hypothetical protein